MFEVSSLQVNIFCLLIISPTIVPEPVLSSPWSYTSKVSFLWVDIFCLLIILPTIAPEPVRSSPWSDAFKVSFLWVDIFCFFIISPTRVPEPVRSPRVSLFSSHNTSLAQARSSWAKHPIRAASSEPARSSPQSNVFEVSSLWVNIFCLLIISPTIVPEPVLSSPWSYMSKVSFLQVDIFCLLIISPTIVPEPVRSSPWSDAFKVSFLRVDIFCLFIISPTRVPEPICLSCVSLFSSHNASLTQAHSSQAKHPICAASRELARSSPQSNASKVSFLRVDIFSSFCIGLECMAMGASTEESKKDPNNCATVLCLGFSFMFCMFCIACSSMSTCTLGQM